MILILAMNLVKGSLSTTTTTFDISSSIFTLSIEPPSTWSPSRMSNSEEGDDLRIEFKHNPIIDYRL
jgi:hypothetical protein